MKIILASNNKNKLKEISSMLPTFEVLSLKDINYTKDIVEDGKTFKENSYIKAKTIFDLYPDAIILADDSGLCVSSLNNEPGIYSHRYSPEGTDEANNLLLLANLEDKKNRKAHFVCSMTVILKYKNKVLVKHTKGILKGKIGFTSQGNNGFGYDPLFIYKNISLASISESEKNKISHRSKALKKAVKIIKHYSKV